MVQVVGHGKTTVLTHHRHFSPLAYKKPVESDFVRGSSSVMKIRHVFAMQNNNPFVVESVRRIIKKLFNLNAVHSR